MLLLIIVLVRFLLILCYGWVEYSTPLFQSLGRLNKEGQQSEASRGRIQRLRIKIHEHQTT